MTREIRISDLIIKKFFKVFNDTDHTHKILTSGRAGTKSSAAAIEVVYKLISIQDCSAVVIRKHHNKLRKTVYKEILRAIKRLGLDKKQFKITVSPMEITYLPNGNTIYFTGSDSVDDTKGIIDENKPIRIVLIDEVTEFFTDGEGEDELQNIEATFIRGNDEDFQMLYLFNPPKNPNAPVMVWLRKTEKRPDCLHVHVDYRDVPPGWLGRKLLEAAEILRQTDERQWLWLWIGQCIGIDELIYYMFGDSCIEDPQEDPEAPDYRRYRMVMIGGDYGQMNATTYQAFGLDEYRHKLQGLGEYYHSGREKGTQRSPSQYAQDAIELMDYIHETYETEVFYFFLDPSAAGLQEEIKRTVREQAPDYAVKVRDAKNEVARGILRTQLALSFGILKIATKQKTAIGEFGTYAYDAKSIDRGKEVPVKEADHCMDAIRYMVMGAWKWIKRWLPKGVDKREDEEDEKE